MQDDELPGHDHACALRGKVARSHVVVCHYEWLGPRASCIVHDVPLERTYDVGGKFCGVKFLVSQRQLCIMHNSAKRKKMHNA